MYGGGWRDKLASETGTGMRYEAETGDKGNTKVYEGKEEDKLASKTGTGGEERSWERGKYTEVYEDGEESKLASKTGTGERKEVGREESMPRCMMVEKRSNKKEAKQLRLRQGRLHS